VLFFFALAFSLVVFQNCSRDAWYDQKSNTLNNLSADQASIASGDAEDMVMALTKAGVKPDVDKGTIYTLDSAVCETAYATPNIIQCTFMKNAQAFMTRDTITVNVRNSLYVNGAKSGCTGGCADTRESLKVTALKCSQVPNAPAQSQCIFTK
jgi:hypothetical protein